MFKIGLFLMVGLITSASAFATTFNYKFKILLDSMDSDLLVHEAQEEGWEIEKNDEGDYLITITDKIDTSELPYTLMTSGPSINISRISNSSDSFLVAINYHYGDYDASVSASTITDGSSSTHLMMTGGDHASGSWSVDSNLVLSPLRSAR